MKIKDLLFESFKDALDKFSNDASTDEVQSYLDKFRQLANKNIIQGADKDIGKWIKDDWYTFKGMIDIKSKEKSKSQIKKAKKEDSIVVYEDDDKMVVVPFTKDASCFYGRQTKWCTAATETKNFFNDYFFKDNATLFYVLLSNGDKYAASYTARYDSFEFFNKLDTNMTSDLFTKETEMDTNQLKRLYIENKEIIEQGRVRNLGNAAIESGDSRKVYLYARDVLKGPFPKGEDIISTNPDASYNYAYSVLKGEFLKGEDEIANRAGYSCMYAMLILKRPFPKGEDEIATNAHYSVEYATIVLKGEFPKGEDIIASDDESSLKYAKNALKRPWPKGEASIAKNYLYSKDYIKFLNKKGFEKESQLFKEKYGLHI